MTVVAVSLVKNAADIIGPIVEHMLTQVDQVIVADNMSTDGTRDILDGLDVQVVEDNDPAHYQGRKMTALAHIARTGYGADWVVPFDADEWWYSPFGTIAAVCEQASDFSVLTAAMFDHVATGADDQSEANPTRRIGWRRRNAAPMHKVAVAATPDLRIHEGNHGADLGFEPQTLPSQLVIRHFPYRSADQFITKARMGSAALSATDLPDDIGQHWRDYGRLNDAQVRDVFAQHFYAADPWKRRDLIFDPAP